MGVIIRNVSETSLSTQHYVFQMLGGILTALQGGALLSHFCRLGKLSRILDLVKAE